MFNFADERLVVEGGYGTVMQSVTIVILGRSHRQNKTFEPTALGLGNVFILITRCSISKYDMNFN